MSLLAILLERISPRVFRTAMILCVAFSLEGMYLIWREQVGPILWFWPAMQVPLW
jgi:hypothetical protein